MIQEILDALTSADAQIRRNAGVEAGNFALGLKTLDLQSQHDFEHLCRQVDAYPEWPESEQHRFRILIQGVRVAAKKAGKLFDSKGNPIW